MLHLTALALLAPADDYKPFDPTKAPEVRAAFALIEKGELLAGLDAIQKAAPKYPLLPPPPVLAANHLMDFGNAARNPNLVRQGRGLLQSCAAQLPGHPDVHISLGTLALQEFRYSDAALQFREAVALADERWTADRRTQFLVFAHLGAARAAEQLGDWQRARASLHYVRQNALAEDATVQMRLGEAEFRCGNRTGGEDLVRQAFRRDPQLKPAETVLGELWLSTPAGPRETPEERAERIAKGDRLLASAAKDFPLSSVAQRRWIDRLLSKGDGAESLAAARAALAAVPADVDYRLLALVAQRQAGDFAGAAKEARRWLDATPKDLRGPKGGRNLWPVIAVQAALALAECEPESDRKAALELCQAAIAETQKARAAGQEGLTEVEAYTALGLCQLRAGQPDQAVAWLKKVLATNEAGSDAAYFYALALHAKGEAAEAARQLDRALAAPGPFVGRARAAALRKSIDPPPPPAKP